MFGRTWSHVYHKSRFNKRISAKSLDAHANDQLLKPACRSTTALWPYKSIERVSRNSRLKPNRALSCSVIDLGAESKQKFDFLNLSLRALVVLVLAKKKGFVCNRDIRKLYSLHKRSKRSESFLLNMVDNGHLKRVGYDKYVLTEKSLMALNVVAPKLQDLLVQDERSPLTEAPLPAQ